MFDLTFILRVIAGTLIHLGQNSVDCEVKLRNTWWDHFLAKHYVFCASDVQCYSYYHDTKFYIVIAVMCM